MKTNIKTVVLFLTAYKNASKYLYLGEKYARARFSSSRFEIRVCRAKCLNDLSLTFLIPGTSETHTEGFPYEIFRHRETKYFQRKIVILLCIKFFDTPNFLKFWSDAREIFWHCETIIIRRKNVIPPVMHKIFRYPKFSGTLKGCPRNILALWDQKFSTEDRDTPSSLPPPSYP